MRLTSSLTAFLSAAAMSAAVTGCASGSGDEEVIGSDSASTDESSTAEGDSAEDAPSDDAQDFEVESGFTSGTDSIGTRYNSAARLQIGFDLKDKPTKLEVQVVGDFTDDAGPRDSFDAEMAVLTVKSTEIADTDYGRELSGQVTNETDEVVTDANWDCVYLNGKTIVGGSSSSIIDPIPPGSTVQFNEPISIDDMPAKSATCRVLSNY